jgi:hypothetical protein
MDADETWQLMQLVMRLRAARYKLIEAGRADGTTPLPDGAPPQAIIQDMIVELHDVSETLAEAAFNGTRRRVTFN